MTETFENPARSEIHDLIKRVKTIAVVGLSASPDRPSYEVAEALQGFGYRIIPVNPAVAEVLGERSYARLDDIPEPVDLVDVFRRPEHVAEVVEDCIRLRVPALWLQEGVVDTAAALKARRAGMTVVMDRCIYRDYLALR